MNENGEINNNFVPKVDNYYSFRENRVKESDQAVHFGAELANKIFDFYNISEVTGGKKFEIDRDSVDFMLDRVPFTRWSVGYDIKEIKEAVDGVNSSKDDSREVYCDSLHGNLLYFVSLLQLDGEYLSSVDVSEKGDNEMPKIKWTEIGDKIGLKIGSRYPLIVDSENQDDILGLVHSYELFLGSMNKIMDMDRQKQESKK